MLEKVKLWIKKVGLTSLGYLAAFLAALFLGKTFLAGAFAGIFVYVNWNVVVKIWNEEIKPEVDKVIDKVEDKLKK